MMMMMMGCIYVCIWQRVWVHCRGTHNKEPLPLTIFIYADDVVRRRRFASEESCGALSDVSSVSVWAIVQVTSSSNTYRYLHA